MFGRTEIIIFLLDDFFVLETFEFGDNKKMNIVRKLKTAQGIKRV